MMTGFLSFIKSSFCHCHLVISSQCSSTSKGCETSVRHQRTANHGHFAGVGSRGGVDVYIIVGVVTGANGTDSSDTAKPPLFQPAVDRKPTSSAHSHMPYLPCLASVESDQALEAVMSESGMVPSSIPRA